MFHIFRSASKRNQWAATYDRTGQNLPNPSQWTFHKAVSESRIAFDATIAAAAIAEKGYYLFSAGVIVGPEKEVRCG